MERVFFMQTHPIPDERRPFFKRHMKPLEFLSIFKLCDTHEKKNMIHLHSNIYSCTHTHYLGLGHTSERARACKTHESGRIGLGRN